MSGLVVRRVPPLDHQAASSAGGTALGLGFAYSLVIAVAFLLFVETIVGIYLDDTVAENRTAASLAVSFPAVGAVFLIADSAQIIIRGALMGLKDTKVPMYISFGSYGLSLPAAGLFGVY
ncbi:MAG: MATE family efflux transporter, partial [Alphaproteobacteria bacterium]